MDLIIHILVLFVVKQIIRTAVRVDTKQPCIGDKLLLDFILWKICNFFVNNICDVRYSPITDRVSLKKNKN